MSPIITRAIFAVSIILVASFGCTPTMAEKKAEGGGGAKGEVSTDLTVPSVEDTAPTLEDENETMELSAETKAAEPIGEVEPAAPLPEAVGEPLETTKCVVEIGEPVSTKAEEEAPTADESEGKKTEPADFQAKGRECAEMTDAEPTKLGSDGKVVGTAADITTEDLVRQRLEERRLEIEAQETSIELQQALLAAAEKRIEERSAVLEQLKQDIEGTVDQSKAASTEQFKAIVAAYETMKPAAAAAIFNEMSDEVLIDIARGMNPRKIASILSKMNPTRAGALTVHLAKAD